jgi:hypothetical protein
MLISMPTATSATEKRRTERLSPGAAFLWIGFLALSGWAAIIALVLALD